MLICGPSLLPCLRVGGFENCKAKKKKKNKWSMSCKSQSDCVSRKWRNYSVRLVTFLAAATVIGSIATGDAIYEQEETLSNIPQTLSGEGKKAKIQKPKSRKAESCTVKCVTTCIRGGEGSPGEGPLNVTSLVECSDICNLMTNADDMP
ncbi:hypothetical protein KIW84_060004 [Lathyrus oleraceus]|uniref:Uncharacterized protein n=1 Tax=Pisum sativum TaxID=3888 RepID=A0A9D4VYE4_PEA|nr:hypothetical protein KIW84_060004 [Pisum sativum]